LPLRAVAQAALAQLLQCPTFAAYSSAHQLTVTATTKVVSASAGHPHDHRAAATFVLKLQLCSTATEWTEVAADDDEVDDVDDGGDHAGQLRLDVVAPTNWVPGALAAMRASLHQQYGLGAAAPLRRFTFRFHDWLNGLELSAEDEEGEKDVRCVRQVLGWWR
jgi:hypothetical protein